MSDSWVRLFNSLPDLRCGFIQVYDQTGTLKDITPATQEPIIDLDATESDLVLSTDTPYAIYAKLPMLGNYDVIGTFYKHNRHSWQITRKRRGKFFAHDISGFTRRAYCAETLELLLDGLASETI